MYSYLQLNNLITKNQSGFRPGDSTTKQLLFLLDDIHKSFDSKESNEVQQFFLIYQKHLIKFGTRGCYLSLNKTASVEIY